MTIDGAGPKGLRPPFTGPTRDVGEGASRRGRTATGGGSDRSDRIEISPEGRALSGELAAADEGLSPERLAELRERLESGYYNTPESAEELARRLLDDDVV